MLFRTQAVSLIVAASGAILGTLVEVRRDGNVTPGGWGAAILVIVGLLVNAGALRLQQKEKAAAEEAAATHKNRMIKDNRQLQEQNQSLRMQLLQARPVRKITISVHWKSRLRNDGGTAILAFIITRNGTYGVIITAESEPKESSICSSVYITGPSPRRLSPLRVTYVESVVSVLSFKKAEVPSQDWFIDVAADLVEVRYYAAIADGYPADERTLKAAIEAVEELAISFDDFRVHWVPRSSFGRNLVYSSGSIGVPQSAVNARQVRFYSGRPNWEALGAKNDPSRVAAFDDTDDILSVLGVKDGDVEVTNGHGQVSFRHARPNDS